MKATLEYELPKEQQAFSAALRGPCCNHLLWGLIRRLTKMANPDDGPEHKGLQALLRQLEQQMEDLGMNCDIEFPESENQ